MIPVVVSFLARSPDEELAYVARRHLGFALDRFAGRIADVRLRIRDENGPRGGEDQHCSLAVKIIGHDELHLHDNDSSAERAIHRLARRAARAVAHALQKRRMTRRGA